MITNASTFSPFHFSMKLSSCDCDALVSVPVMVSTPVVPCFTFIFFNAGIDELLGPVLAVLLREHRDLLALQRLALLRAGRG